MFLNGHTVLEIGKNGPFWAKSDKLLGSAVGMNSCKQEFTGSPISGRSLEMLPVKIRRLADDEGRGCFFVDAELIADSCKFSKKGKMVNIEVTPTLFITRIVY